MEGYEARRDRNPHLTEKQWLKSTLLLVRKYLYGMSYDPIFERWQCAEMESISRHLSRILVAESVEEEMGELLHHLHLAERAARDVVKGGDVEKLRKVLEILNG